MRQHPTGIFKPQGREASWGGGEKIVQGIMLVKKTERKVALFLVSSKGGLFWFLLGVSRD